MKRDRAERVIARGVGLLELGSLVDHADGGTGDGGALRVTHEAIDLSGVELGVDGRCEREKRQRQRPW